MYHALMPRDWPALFVGLLMLLYWASVIVMVIKTKKDVGKAANFLPPEPVGRIVRLLWYPVVIIWIVHPISYALVHRPARWARPPRQFVHVQDLAWPALAIAIAAFAATLVCWRRMGKSWRMGIDPNETTELIVRGPYAYVRHPIYTLSITLMACTMVILPSPIMLVTGALHIAFLLWESRREERYLLHIHGQPYADYSERTGRFFPRTSRQSHRPASGILPRQSGIDPR